MAATTVDTLLVRIEADLSGLRRDFQKVQTQTNSASKKMQKSLGGVDKSAQFLSRSFKTLALAAGAFFGAGALVRSIRTFEDLQATLKAVTGSSKLAAQSFKLITKFTAQTTFQLDEVTGAFITLVNAGIAPTEDALKDIGNIAAARGKDIRQVAQAIFNATTGEMEMLKQLGIIAKVDGEQLAVTYKGVTEQIERSGDSIVKYIRDLSQAEFPNAIEERANTLSGAISNLEDSISLFFLEVGEAGLKQALTDLVKFFIDGSSGATSLATVLGKTLGGAVRGLNKVLAFLADNFRNLTIAFSVFLAVNFVARVAAITGSILALAKGITLARIAQQALNKSMLKNPFILAATGALILANEFNKLDPILKAIEDKFGDFFDISKEGTQDMEDLNAAIATLGTSSTVAGKVVETDFTKTIANLKKEAKLAKSELKGLDAEFLSALDAAGGLGNIQGNTISMPKDEEEAKTLGVPLTGPQITQIEKLVKARKKATSALQTHNEAMEEGQNIAKGFIPEQEVLQKQLDNVRLAMRGAAEDDIPLYEQAIKDLQFQIKMTNPQFEALHSAAMQAADGISNALADAFVNGKLSLQSLGDVFKQVVKQMIADAIKAQIVKFLMGSIFGAAGGGSVSSFGGSGNAAQANSTLSHAGGGSISRYGRAGGGMAMPTLVGERGPELFVPHTAGVVRNNHDTKNMMGGGSPVVVNQNINIDAGVSQTVRAEVMSMMPRIKSETIQAMIDGKRRGNSISKAFA
jgi:hypothetical protein